MRRKVVKVVCSLLAVTICLVIGFVLCFQVDLGAKVKKLDTLIIDETGDIKNDEVWVKLLESVKEKEDFFVEIQRPGKEVEDPSTLEYQNERYFYTVNGCKSEYKYLQELSGKMPNAAGKSTFIILSNTKYSFDEIAKSLYSSNYKEAHSAQYVFLL